MSYTPHNFEQGQVLNASALNDMEQGIVDNETAINGKASLTGATFTGMVHANSIEATSMGCDDLTVNTLYLNNIDSGDTLLGVQRETADNTTYAVIHIVGKDGKLYNICVNNGQLEIEED